MKTYSGYNKSSGRPIFEKVSITDVFLKLPAGSRLVSGNITDRETGKLIIRALYQHGDEQIVVTEDEPKETKEKL